MALIESFQGFLNMASGLPSIPLFFAYLAMIFLSKFWHKVAAPMELRVILILHNFSCCLLSVISLCAFCLALYNNGSIYGKSPDSVLVFTFWLYWVTKVIELLDTVFMIVRHKWRQISFLHVYHHSSMLILSDMSRLYYPWPSIATFLAINSLVHVILYLYYGLTALNPANPPKWKKLMTQIQIIQFVIGFFIAGYGYQVHRFCVYSLFYGITMISLFSNFYYHAYMKKRNVTSSGKPSAQSNGKQSAAKANGKQS